MSKYQYIDGMGEISGFGGGYEAACRSMVIAAMEWADEHPNADLNYKEYKNIYGITTDETPDIKKVQDVMFKASGEDCTGAMMQASLGHFMFAHKNGWEEYTKKMMEKAKENAD